MAVAGAMGLPAGGAHDCSKGTLASSTNHKERLQRRTSTFCADLECVVLDAASIPPSLLVNLPPSVAAVDGDELLTRNDLASILRAIDKCVAEEEFSDEEGGESNDEEASDAITPSVVVASFSTVDGASGIAIGMSTGDGQGIGMGVGISTDGQHGVGIGVSAEGTGVGVGVNLPETATNKRVDTEKKRGRKKGKKKPFYDRFSGDMADLCTGTLLEAARGLMHYMNVKEDHIYTGVSLGTAAIIEEVRALNDEEAVEMLNYILYERASEKEYPNGIRDLGRNGERLADFCAHEYLSLIHI